MNTTIRHSLSAAAGLRLLSFTITSAILAGLFSTAAVAGFALLAAYGVLEIALLSYATPTAVRPRAVAMPASTSAAPVLVAFPLAHRTACAMRAA